MCVSAIDEKWDREFEKEQGVGLWEGWEGGKGGGNDVIVL